MYYYRPSKSLSLSSPPSPSPLDLKVFIRNNLRRAFLGSLVRFEAPRNKYLRGFYSCTVGLSVSMKKGWDEGYTVPINHLQDVSDEP